jgi:hypothetical protein
MRRDSCDEIRETAVKIHGTKYEVNASGRKKNGLGSLNNKG